MPHISISNFSYSVAQKHILKNVSLQLARGVYGLVGNNGSGKSTLINAIAKLDGCNNTIKVTGKTAIFSQLNAMPNCSVAGYLGIADKLNALSRINAGSIDVNDYQTLQDDWHCERDTITLLTTLALPKDPFISCNKLSYGQLARLMLHRCFNSDADIILLDEPTNHLDLNARRWLSGQITAFRGIVVMASHDENLLDHSTRTLHVINGTVNEYGVGYHEFKAQFNAEQKALRAKQEHIKREQTQFKRIAQLSLEKAHQRAAQGKQKRASGSQPKVLLDSKKDAASKSHSRQVKLQKARIDTSNKMLRAVCDDQVLNESVTFHIADINTHKNKVVVNINNWKCEFNHHPPLNATIKQTSRVWLQGRNGSGKSTLLKNIANLSKANLAVNSNCDVIYLEQNCRWLDQYSDVLTAIMALTTQISEQTARTLLASTGFRGDSVFLPVESLSGGEKMKLAMLCVSRAKKDALLLLDEPDNHLDIAAKTALAISLKNYPGAFILVSHDTQFVEQVGVNMRLDINSGSAIEEYE